MSVKVERVIVCKSDLEIGKRDIYRMTSSPDMIGLSDVADGTKIKVDAICLFNDIKNPKEGEETGDMVKLASILSGDDIYVTNSSTLPGELMTIYGIMSNEEDTDTTFTGDEFEIEKYSGTSSKNNRTYIGCKLA